MLQLKSNPHIAYELWQWNKYGSERIDQASKIPDDPRFVFDVLYACQPSSTDPVRLTLQQKNEVVIGCGIGSLEEGIAQWAKRFEIRGDTMFGTGGPRKVTGGYTQSQFATLPDSLCIDIVRRDWKTKKQCTDRFKCPTVLDFADGACATALAPGVAPCQYRLVGLQVGELRGEDEDPNYITWWGYVWDEGRLAWHGMDDDCGTLSPASEDEVLNHLDAESSGTTFPLRLYYRKIPPFTPLPEMPKDLIDWDAPWGYMRVPRKGPLRWVTGTDSSKPLLPIPDEKQEKFTLVEKVVRDPVLGSFGTIFVQMIGHKFPMPAGDDAAFASRERNFNIGGPGDKFVVVGFTPTYQEDTPDDAILNDEREPWPTVPETGRKVDRLDPRVPAWAKSWNGSMQQGMPIPSWLAFEVAAKMAYYKHVHFNMLRMDLLNWWDHLDSSASKIFAKRPTAKTLLLTEVSSALTSVRHGHVTQLELQFDEEMRRSAAPGTCERMSLPAPRTVQSLIMLTERLTSVANKYLYHTGRRIEISNLTEETVRKLEPFTFDRPNETLDDTANRFHRAILNAVDPRGDSERDAPKPKTDAEKAEEEAERERLRRKAVEANAWLEARRKERDDKLAAPMLAEQKRKQEAKEQAKAAEEASAKAKLKEQLESEKRAAEARERAQKEEADRKAAEAAAAKEAAKAARLEAAEKKKKAKKESRKTPLQREQEAQAAAAAKEQEDNDAMVARVEKKLAAIALAKRSV